MLFITLARPLLLDKSFTPYAGRPCSWHLFLDDESGRISDSLSMITQNLFVNMLQKRDLQAFIYECTSVSYPMVQISSCNPRIQICNNPLWLFLLTTPIFGDNRTRRLSGIFADKSYASASIWFDLEGFNLVC